MSQNDLLEKLKDIAGESQVRTDEPMSSHTTFRIGGTADYFVMPSSVEELQTIIRLLKKSDINYYVIGNGSNLLVGDKGFRGVIIQLSDAFDEVEYIDDVTVKAMSGMKLSRLGNRLSDKGLAGFEFATGIPGTIGGAVRMNAGAYGGEIKDIIVSAEVLDQNGDIHIRINLAELLFDVINNGISVIPKLNDGIKSDGLLVKVCNKAVNLKNAFMREGNLCDGISHL